ncbi:MAG TPA: hypothetical protein VIL64_02810 [Solirubrobacteraceae bacterium]
MSRAEAPSWWADVEHMREPLERRRAAESDARVRARHELAGDPPADEQAGEPLPFAAIDDVDELATRRARRITSSAPRRRSGGRPGRRTIEIRGQVAPTRPSAIAVERALLAVERREAEHARLIAAGAEVAPEPLAAPRPARRMPRMNVATMGPRPDRIALWAFVLGMLLIVVAATSPH